MQLLVQLAVLVCTLSLVLCAHDLSEDYSFKATLNTAEKGGLYELYWTFDNAAETISFAVRVQTMGWVGFGISSNGQMPNSDVIMGWVDNGTVFFQDRFATTRSPPPVDKQQDWKLVNGEEEGGFTILKFTRKYITCDKDDLPITTETVKIIWSFHDTTDPSSEDISFDLIHTYKGSISLNLLGGLPSAAPDPDDLQYYDITVDNITIPSSDTTYWCAAFQLPEKIRRQTRYITKFGPLVTEGNEAHVHHLIIYLCNGLSDIHLGSGGRCEDEVADKVEMCRGEIIIAAWTVGGEMFVYPENVAFPFGGDGFPEYVVMELHYDNPHMKSGTTDSSGVRMWYTDTPREHDAGILNVGHIINHGMIIPPNSKNFTITTIINEECTNKLRFLHVLHLDVLRGEIEIETERMVIVQFRGRLVRQYRACVVDSLGYVPEDGIHILANMFHTHVAGRGLTLQHLRYNSECGVYEELEPIDRNLQYDFNYQQINHLTRERVILPGDLIQLKCFYGTEDVDNITIGGLSTRDEMCLSFLIFYPRVDLALALSSITPNKLIEYLQTLPSEASDLIKQGQYVEGLNAVDWDEERRQTLQETLQNSTQILVCGGRQDFVPITTELPEVGCSYISLDQCTGSTHPTCCERVNGVEDAGVVLTASMALFLVLSALPAIF